VDEDLSEISCIAEEVERLTRHIGSLGPIYREVMELVLDGKKATEIAEITDTKPRTVWVQIHRGKDRLREKYRREE